MNNGHCVWMKGVGRDRQTEARSRKEGEGGVRVHV